MCHDRKQFRMRLLCVQIRNSLAFGCRVSGQETVKHGFVVCPKRKQFNMRLLCVRIGNSLACGC